MPQTIWLIKGPNFVHIPSIYFAHNPTLYDSTTTNEPYGIVDFNALSYESHNCNYLKIFEKLSHFYYSIRRHE